MNLHPDCYKIVDSRIDLVLDGRLSLEMFALMLGPDDPFVLVGDTLYALSEDEFYTTRRLPRLTDRQEQTFKYVLALKDISFMQPQHQELVKKIREELPTCPVCKYKRYKEAVRQLAEFYKLPVQYTMEKLLDDISYPAVKAPVASTVTTLVDVLYKDLPALDRAPCMECVEKHIAQAHILACESRMGYPEHRVLMCGHLAEAIDEAPKEFPELRQTLQTCLSITMKTNEAYLPIYPVLNLITFIRKHLRAAPAIETRVENPMVTDTIDITPDIQVELNALSDALKNKLIDECLNIKKFILKYKISKAEIDRILFEGTIANLADAVVYTAPLLANMLRNRRLMFVADPALALDAGYDFQDIIEHTRITDD